MEIQKQRIQLLRVQEAYLKKPQEDLKSAED
jgi:hypothetical protein